MKSKPKYLLWLLLIIAVLCSAALPRRDLRATEQVAGIALDRTENGIRATFELYKAEPQKTIGAEKEVVSAEGASLEECVKNALRTFGKELFAADASALLIADKDAGFLTGVALRHYCAFREDQMDLPVFYTLGEAEKVFGKEGPVLSVELVESAKRMKRIQTVRDLMNGRGNPVLIRGEGNYEIIS